MMSASNGAEQKDLAASRLRPRHRISRSISERSPIHLHRHHHTSHHGSRSRRDKHDRASERDELIQHTRSAGSALALQPRTSLEVPRWEAANTLTPGSLSPDQSRRASALTASGDERMAPMQEVGSGTALYTRKLSGDAELQEERLRAAARARYASVSSSRHSPNTKSLCD